MIGCSNFSTNQNAKKLLQGKIKLEFICWIVSRGLFHKTFFIIIYGKMVVNYKILAIYRQNFGRNYKSVIYGSIKCYGTGPRRKTASWNISFEVTKPVWVTHRWCFLEAFHLCQNLSSVLSNAAAAASAAKKKSSLPSRGTRWWRRRSPEGAFGIKTCSTRT